MKPWPAELQAMFPPAPDRLSDRSWWRRTMCDDGSEGISIRTDGARSYRPATFDRENPLSFPGVRVGQVWVHPTWVRACKDYGPYIANAVSFVRGDTAEFGPWATPISIDDLRLFGFLIADPCCPHLAPWTPPEPKHEV